MRKIIIIGASHHNTLSVVRCIGEQYGQIDLVLIGCSKSFVAKSKYVKTATFLKDSEDLYQWALLNKESAQGKPVIISCADGVSQLFDTHYEELCQYLEFFNAGKNGRITVFMDKQKQVKLAKKVGFLTPISSCFTSSDSHIDFPRYPCLVKPLQSYAGGKYIWHCHNAHELGNVIKAAPNGIKLQVQELINNKFEIVLPGLITQAGINVPGYILKHRDFLGGTTYSSVKKHNSETQKMVSFAEKMLREIGYDGLFGVEAIFDGENFYFIELNLRNDATCYSMAVAGVNLPALYIESVLGNQHKSDIDGICEIESMVENKDFSHVMRRKIGLCQWIKELKGAQCKFLYNKNDKRPFYACLCEQMTNKIH